MQKVFNIYSIIIQQLVPVHSFVWTSSIASMLIFSVTSQARFTLRGPCLPCRIPLPSLQWLLQQTRRMLHFMNITFDLKYKSFEEGRRKVNFTGSTFNRYVQISVSQLVSQMTCYKVCVACSVSIFASGAKVNINNCSYCVRNVTYSILYIIWIFCITALLLV